MYTYIYLYINIYLYFVLIKRSWLSPLVRCECGVCEAWVTWTIICPKQMRLPALQRHKISSQFMLEWQYSVSISDRGYIVRGLIQTALAGWKQSQAYRYHVNCLSDRNTIYDCKLEQWAKYLMFFHHQVVSYFYTNTWLQRSKSGPTITVIRFII
jgi:hypothetical protein